MKKEEYDIELGIIKSVHLQRIKDLRIEYAVANNKVSIGDIIVGMGAKIKVTKINPTICFGSEYPECLYKGIKLRKDNVPFSNGDYDTIYQSRIEEHIKQ